jgi:hypothetical protein
MNNLLNEDAAQDFGKFIGEKSKLDYAEILKKCLVNPLIDYPKPDAVVSIMQKGFEIPLLTRNSISGIIGKAKGGKTTLTALIAASVLNRTIGDGDCKLLSIAKGKVLFFDTEQGSYYASMTLQRIKAIATNVDRLEYYDLREYPPNIRLELIRFRLAENEEFSLVIIDGGRDVIFDINSSEEATTVITELMAMTANFNTHICVILHQNKGDNHARGHFGAELVNKSEIVLSVNKANENPNVSLVEPEFSRGVAFEKFAIERRENGVPYIVDGADFLTSDKKKKALYPQDIEEERHRQVINNAFKGGYMKTYENVWKEVQNQFASESVPLGDSKAKEFLKYYVDVEWIVKVKPSKGYAVYKPVNTTQLS